MTSAIEWTDETWNPTVGCSRVSPGCDNCYAARVAHRGLTADHRGLTIRTNDGGVDWTGEVRLLPDRLARPFHWSRPRRVFVDSMSDLFEPDVPDRYIARVFAVMSLTGRHTYQVLTKRPQRAATLLQPDQFARILGEAELPEFTLGQMDRAGARAWDDWHGEHATRSPFPNIWLGTSIETDRYTFRAEHLRRTPAAIRFLSLEPLLGPVPSLELCGIGWVIVGGESGPGHRPMDLGWVRDIRDRCTDAGVPLFVKQLGSHHGADHHQLAAFPADLQIRQWPTAA